MSFIKIIAITVISTLFVNAQTKQSSQLAAHAMGEEWTIIPGEKVGGIVVGSPLNPAVIAKLGKPSSKFVGNQKDVDCSNFCWKDNLIVYLGDGTKSNVVNTIGIMRKGIKYRTDKGIGIGSTLAAVKMAYADYKLEDAMEEGDLAVVIQGAKFIILKNKVYGIYITKK